VTVAVNPYRGEAAITLAGRTYVLRLTMNALAVVEQTLDTTEVALALGRASIRARRAAFHAALTTPDRNGVRLMPDTTTLEEVGHLIDEAGGLGRGSPVMVAYWEMVIGTGFLDRETVEEAGYVPRSQRPGKGDGIAAEAAATVPEAVGA
jgi:hypothetical protein